MSKFIILIALASPFSVLANEGHGVTPDQGTSLLHYFSSPLHLFGVLLAVTTIYVLYRVAKMAWSAFKAPTAHAHCDGPCGVYDPSQARVAAEAVLAMTKKMHDLQMPAADDAHAMLEYQNTMARYVHIKEDEAENTKHHLLVLWTDFFKPEHLEKFPELHEVIWKATKLCSETKHHVSIEAAEQLLASVEQVHKMFWETKGKDVPWIVASA